MIVVLASPEYLPQRHRKHRVSQPTTNSTNFVHRSLGEGGFNQFNQFITQNSKFKTFNHKGLKGFRKGTTKNPLINQFN